MSYPEIKEQNHQPQILELSTVKTKFALPNRDGQQEKGMLLLMSSMSH